MLKKQKYVRIEGGSLSEISPKIYVPELYVNNNYVKFPLRGAIVKKDDGDGFLIERGESIVLLLMGYHVDIIDVDIHGNVGFVVVHEPEEGVPMADPWYGGLLLELPPSPDTNTKIRIKYEVDNGVQTGDIIIVDGGKIKYHRIKDFWGRPIRLEQILEQD